MKLTNRQEKAMFKKIYLQTPQFVVQYWFESWDYLRLRKNHTKLTFFFLFNLLLLPFHFPGRPIDDLVPPNDKGRLAIA